MPVADLQGIYIAVTRPEHQAANLCQLLEQHGAQVLRFPVIEIKQNPTTEFFSIIKHLSEYDMAVFISANAVSIALNIIRSNGDWPNSLKIAAVGLATAKALENSGKTVNIFPKERFNSEALLALDAMQDVTGKKIVIFRGHGGRDLLADTLINRGATVDYAECYQRIKPNINVAPLLQALRDQKLDIIVVTSNEGLSNLYEMVGESGRKPLLNTPLLVVGERATKLAKHLQFHNDIIVAERASDDSLLSALSKWRKNYLIH